MRDIPNTAASIKGASGLAHRVALLVKFDSGDYCYTSDGWDPGFSSGTTLRQRVSQWGGMNAVLESSNPTAFAQAQFQVTILDPDGELYAKWEDEQFQRREVTLYWAVFTPGEAEPTYQDSVLIMQGVIVPPVAWSEGSRELALEVTDLSVRYETLVGVRATIDDFPAIGEDYEGSIVPLIYGTPDMVRPIYVNGGIEAKLVNPIYGNTASPDPTTDIAVDDAERFPQGVHRLYMVGRELFEAQFDGNYGTTAVRSVDIYTGTTTAASTGSCTLRDAGLLPETDATYPINCFVGFDIIMEMTGTPGVGDAGFLYWLQYTVQQHLSLPAYANQGVGFGDEQAQRVIRFAKAQSTIEWNRPFVVETSIFDDGAGGWDVDGFQLRIGTGVEYTIGTVAKEHMPGDRVFLWHPTATAYDPGTTTWPLQDYLVGMGECTVRQVYVHGYLYKPRTLYLLHATAFIGAPSSVTALAEQWLQTPEASRTEPVDDWIPLRGDLWETDTITIDGQTVTRLRMKCRPTWLVDYVCTTDDIRVDVTGPTDAGGSVIQNPAEVIEDIFARYGGYASTRGLEGLWKIDETSGPVAEDSADDHDGRRTDLVRWHPDAGRIDGAAEFDPSMNYCLQSSHLAIDGAGNPWTHVAITVAAQQIPGLYGTMLDLLTLTGAVGYAQQSFAGGTLPADGDATVSAVFAEDTALDVTLRCRDTTMPADRASAIFRWVGGDLTVLAALVGTPYVENLGGGLWRASIYANAYNAGGTHDIFVGTRGVAGETCYAGDVAWNQSQRALRYYDTAWTVQYPTITIPNDASLQAACAGQYSIAFWLRPEDLTAMHGIMTKKAVDGGIGFEIFYTIVAGDVRLVITTQASSAEGTVPWAPDTWKHVAFVVNNTLVSIYVDGVDVTIDGTMVVTAESTAPLVLGYTYEVTPHLNGWLDDVRLYDRLLSSSEVAALATPQHGTVDILTAQANLTSWYMRFARHEITPLRELIADLAFQSRCRLRWLDENPDILYLGVDGGEADYEFGTNRVLLNSGVTGREEIEQAVSRVIATWVEDGEDKAIMEADASVEDDIGIRERTIECWAYDRQSEPEVLARFYLHMWRRLHNTGGCGLTLDGVAAEPGDVVELDSTLDGLLAFAPTKARLVSVTHEAGTSPDLLPREEVEFKAFRWDGCNNACEGSCETTGCESACEDYWEPDACTYECETECESACELDCQTGGELLCSDHGCEDGAVVGCYWLCQNTVMFDVPCGSCEDACQCTCTNGGVEPEDPYEP